MAHLRTGGSCEWKLRWGWCGGSGAIPRSRSAGPSDSLPPALHLGELEPPASLRGARPGGHGVLVQLIAEQQDASVVFL